jgi:hypothetical protein
MSEPFNADAARRGGMSDHHIDWSTRLAEALAAEQADPSPQNRAAYDELARQVQAAREYEREEAAGVPAEERLGVERADGTWEWHSTVPEPAQDPDVETPRPVDLPAGARLEPWVSPQPGDAAATAPPIDGGVAV